eukprot:TRINITY_DN55532_c0_g1_i1.p1 TRINITY_DN55532_c0_g1~~TRINITY_DN55532_c0_g1_i1.p1  ORF type:complete len:668 (+),score=75.89 TRINITY_DN55532_c0_g1_i1:549-2552(+)
MRARKEMAASFLAFFIVFIVLATRCSSIESAQIDSCLSADEHVTIPLRVSITFAGTLPLFMREPTWTLEAKKLFLTYLASKVRHVALPITEEEDVLVSLVGKLHPNTCSVVGYSYNYDMNLAGEKTASALDSALESIRKESPSIFVNGTAVADKFWDTLQSDANFRASEDPNVYNVLVYDAISVAPQYGYRAEPGGAIGTVAMASEKRFAIIDVGAKPFFLAAESLTVGDLLTTNSKSTREYALQLHGIISKLLTPRVSTRMRRFPHETRLAFKLNLVDASAVIGRISGVAGDSEGNKPLGSSFSAEQFMKVLNTVFHNHVIPDKDVSITVEDVDMMQESRMAMAVSRAFSMKGLEMVLDSERLINSLMRNSTDRYGYFVDSSYIAHIPMYLFSFADDSRVTHFDTGEQLRARVVGKEAVVIAENRLRDGLDEYISTTSEATKEVLELLCGLDQESLSVLSSQTGAVPLILRDIAKRNILVQELDWTQAVASWKAKELLDFEGLDSRLIPHQQGSRIEMARGKVRSALRKLTEQWRKASLTMKLDDVESATMYLMGLSTELADMLHEEVCNQPLPEEILIKAEAEVMGGKGSTKHRKRWRLLRLVVFSAVAGIMFGSYLHQKALKQQSFRGTYLDDLSIAPAVRNLDVTATTQWFSTLTSSYKSKTH